MEAVSVVYSDYFSLADCLEGVHTGYRSKCRDISESSFLHEIHIVVVATGVVHAEVDPSKNGNAGNIVPKPPKQITDSFLFQRT